MADAGEFNQARPRSPLCHRERIGSAKQIGVGPAQHQGGTHDPIPLWPEVDIGGSRFLEGLRDARVVGKAQAAVRFRARRMGGEVTPLRVGERAEARGNLPLVGLDRRQIGEAGVGANIARDPLKPLLGEQRPDGR